MKEITVKIFEKLDPETMKHSLRTCNLVKKMASVIGISNLYREKLIEAAMLHDIGKLFIPKEILFKKDYLTDFEKDLIDTHSEIGYKYLKFLEYDPDICKIVKMHHNIVDDIKENSELIKCIKILMIADVYDALTSSRTYRGAYSPKNALKIMKNMDKLNIVYIHYLIKIKREGSINNMDDYNIEKFKENLGIVNEGNIVDDDDYEESVEVDIEEYAKEKGVM